MKMKMQQMTKMKMKVMTNQLAKARRENGLRRALSVHIIMKKQKWQDRCRDIIAYHEKHEASVRDIADEYGLSVGQAATCLTLAFAMRVHDELENIKHYTKALEFIKDKDFRRHFD